MLFKLFLYIYIIWTPTTDHFTPLALHVQGKNMYLDGALRYYIYDDDDDYIMVKASQNVGFLFNCYIAYAKLT